MESLCPQATVSIKRCTYSSYCNQGNLITIVSPPYYTYQAPRYPQLLRWLIDPVTPTRNRLSIEGNTSMSYRVSLDAGCYYLIKRWTHSSNRNQGHSIAHCSYPTKLIKPLGTHNFQDDWLTQWPPQQLGAPYWETLAWIIESLRPHATATIQRYTFSINATRVAD